MNTYRSIRVQWEQIQSLFSPGRANTLICLWDILWDGLTDRQRDSQCCNITLTASRFDFFSVYIAHVTFLLQKQIVHLTFIYNWKSVLFRPVAWAEPTFASSGLMPFSVVVSSFSCKQLSLNTRSNTSTERKTNTLSLTDTSAYKWLTANHWVGGKVHPSKSIYPVG